MEKYIIIEKSIRQWGSGTDPPTLTNFCDFHQNFHKDFHLNFPLKLPAWPPKQANNSILEYERVRGAKLSEGKRKLQNFYRKTGLFPLDLKEFNVK